VANHISVGKIDDNKIVAASSDFTNDPGGHLSN
jgi:hypothetical protein